MRGRRGADDLRNQSDGGASSDRRLCRSYPQGRQASGPPGRTVHQVRACHQPGDGPCARSHRARDAARPRRRGDRMIRRREFITLLGGAASWPLAARAQRPALPVVGFLGSLSQSAQSTWTAAFVQRMREHGWIEDRTVAIEYRWAEGRRERFAEIAAEFVRLKVDVIVTAGTDAVIAVKKVTSVIPIVFGTAGDPVANGLVGSLARPGGNVTGLSNQSADIAGKRIDLLQEIVPNLRRLAIMANVGSSIGVLEMLS